jgi:erythrin-vacuolar iron transport family protein
MGGTSGLSRRAQAENKMRSFDSLGEKEILALAAALEEEDARIYDNFADGLQKDYPEQAAKFIELREQEVGHQRRLLDLYHARFGKHVPLLRREDVSGFVKRPPLWLERPLQLKSVRKQAALMESETERFYLSAANRTTDPAIHRLLLELAEEEQGHCQFALSLGESPLSVEESKREQQRFALQVVQPGLAGLMDGSISTLAPLFAAAFATHKSWETFLVGLAASVGAGISMGFAEALSDDGKLTGRGHPFARGIVCGTMTAAGGLGHTLPFLIPDMRTAMVIALGVVGVELGVIAWVRHRYMDTPWSSAVLQVVLGGLLVFGVGVLIGSS